MAERKKRGLGRGLGALIPDANSSDRPVDVFFSGGDSEQSASSTDAETRAPRAARSDPAASMQSSRRRKPKAATAGKTAGAKTSDSKGHATEAPAKKSSPAKPAGKTSTSRTSTSKTSTNKTSSAAKSGTASTASGSGSSTSPSATKASTANGASSTKDSSRAKSSSTTKASGVSPRASRSEESAEKSATNGESSSVDDASLAATSEASPKPSDDVFETHPGVYTSSGALDGAEVDSENETESPSTTEVVSQPNDLPGSAGDAATLEDDGAAEDQTEAGELDGVESIPDTEFGEIDVELIDANPRQPRTVFDEDMLAELVHSIREIGVLQPVVVRQKPSDPSRFELIMGERRLRATKDAGLSSIPAIIRYVEDTDLLRDALLENLHRAELNPLEEAAAYGQLLEDFGCTQEELSERIGRSRPQISNTLRLLRLPPLVQRRVAAGVISAGHARAILGLRDAEHMEVLAQRIVAEGLSVRASEEAVVLLNRGDSVNVSRATSRVSPEFLAVAERLGDRLDTKVNISVGKRKGKLSVEFANQEDLDRILSLLGIAQGE